MMSAQTGRQDESWFAQTSDGGRQSSGLIFFLHTFTLYNFQLRSLLAMLCLAVSIATFMQLLALETGIGSRLAAILSVAGADTVTLNAGTISLLPNRGGGIAPASSLSLADRDTLTALLPGVLSGEPVVAGARFVEFRELGDYANVYGVSDRYLDLMGYVLDRGRMIDDLDEAAMARVVVIGSSLAGALFGNAQDSVLDAADIPGRVIRIGDTPFEIIGTLRPKGGSQIGMDLDMVAFIPFRTAQRRVFNQDFLNSILLAVAGGADRNGLTTDIGDLLRDNHGLPAGGDADFEMLTAAPALDMLDFSDRIIRSAFRALAWLTGVIAGIGILVINYLNMQQRQSEIGLRKAVGARWRDIMAMILLENALGGLLGGLGGLVLGLGIYVILGGLTAWPLVLELSVILAPFAGAVALATLAALVPAWLAAGMQPVVALGRK